MKTSPLRNAPFLLCLLCFVLFACKGEDVPLVKIGELKITLATFRREIQPLKTELLQLPLEQQRLLLRQALSQRIDQELLQSEAQSRGIEISEFEIQQALTELRGDYSEEEYLEILRKSGQDPDHWMQQLRIRLLNKKVAASITQGMSHIDKRQIEEYYLQHLKDYNRPEQVQARQILVTTESEALKLRDRVLAGESFISLARQYSISPDRENGGDLGLFAAGQFLPEFDDILFKLPPGQISQPINSAYGVHLFLVEKRYKAGVLPLDEVKDMIRQQLKSGFESQLYRHWLQEIHEKNPVQIDWEQLDKLLFNKAE